MKDIDLLETEAMAKAYDASKPDELLSKSAVDQDKSNDLLLDISHLIGNIVEDNDVIKQTFRYVKMMDCDWKCHLSLLLNYKYGVLIPSEYTIFYSASDDNNLEKGKIKFLKDNPKDVLSFIFEYETG